MKRDILLERRYPHPPQRVWRALTDPRVLSEWLMENDFRPEVGHAFTFHTKPMPGFDGVVRCEVTEVEPPHLLAYTWQGGPMRTPTHVTWTLTPIDEGTHVRLEHTGFEGAAEFLVSYLLGSGWQGLLGDRLPALLAELAAETEG